MNTNKLKKFAQQTRKKLLTQVNARLELVLTSDSAELREKAAQVNQLQKAINASSKAQVVEKIAYTWFNRLMALRFMDANDYQPIGIRVVTPKEGHTLPELLDETKQGNIPPDLSVKTHHIYDLLDGKIPSANAQNEAYKALLIGACNHLHKIFPFLFDRINSFAELLLPDDLTSEFSVVQDIVDGMSTEDCQEVEVIGWLYQFYISERKDEVFAAKGKVEKEDIPAATQLFTPQWIVQYMVQNTLGKLWLQNKPNSKLREQMPYFIESPSVKIPFQGALEGEGESFLKVNSVEEITLLDQACGSGHILVYAFELFSKIYEEEGYNPSEIPQLIIEKNLHGFEIDERAAQLAGLALMMKARSYQRRVFRKNIRPNILCYRDLTLKMYAQDDFFEFVKIKKDGPLLKKYLEYGYHIATDIQKKWQDTFIDKNTDEVITPDRVKTLTFKGKQTEPNDLAILQNKGAEVIAFYDDEVRNVFRELSIPLSEKVYSDLVLMKQATNFGSLIIPKASFSDLATALKLLYEKVNIEHTFLRNQIEALIIAFKQLIPLSRKYHCVVDNPPYMGGGNMNRTLSAFVKKNYPDSKADLMACFMEVGLKMLRPKGFLGMINQHSWMFLSSYEKLRKKLIQNTFFDTLLHLGPRTFPEIGGEVVQNAAFVFWNYKVDAKGVYVRLVDFKDAELKREKTREAINKNNCEFVYKINQNNFQKIPRNITGYWSSINFIKTFSETKLKSLCKPKMGMRTGNNTWFLRYWHEVVLNKFAYENLKKKKLKWIAYRKGGGYRKWFGNMEYVVNWEGGGYRIKENTILNYPQLDWDNLGWKITNESFFFKEGIEYSRISTGALGARKVFSGSIFDSASCALFPKEANTSLVLGYLNSIVSQEYLKIISPTLTFQAGDVGIIPCLLNNEKTIDSLVARCIDISKSDWNSRETSWDFQNNELINHKSQNLQETYHQYKTHWKSQHHQLHQNEEELNRQFIEIYGLQDELTPDVPLKDITILKQETSIENGVLVFHADEVFAQFMSYAVGCMFGRYSLDKAGLILANQGETLEDYLEKVGKTAETATFLPDDDNIIPILDDEWFEDDIVGRFYEFLKVTFGKENYDKNLTFIEDCLGKDIRKYFVKDFYKDHIKRYKKRPIYWLFSSPKGSFNVLIYLHRYTADTLNQILNGYLIEYREKLRSEIEQLNHIKNTGTSTEQNKADKKIDKIKVILLELQEYEREIVYPLATERIKLDLDDGVLVNYNKFGKAIKEVKGLNDKKAKDKVLKFDWIDTSTIK